MTVRPNLDQLVDAAGKLPPGPEAWTPIFKHYPELSAADVARLFREAFASPFLLERRRLRVVS